MYVSFDDWTQGRTIVSLGTNAGAMELPFQSWRHFKEAFAPELIARAVKESRIQVTRCIDPFGGSGTTALACQFLGVHPTTIEVNPYLADLIEAKLTTYDADKLARDLGMVLKMAATNPSPALNALGGTPPSFVEPGVQGRWIFDRAIAKRICSLLKAIDQIQYEAHRRLFRVLLGGILIDVSNVVISGKGRRYRRGWQRRQRDPKCVDELFAATAERAICDIHRYANRKCSRFEVIRGDSRVMLRQKDAFELAVFSPPYPNSFDYTDVYNVELWVLGYLSNSSCNRSLRTATLCSHVQVSRDFAAPPSGSEKLNRILNKLRRQRDALWDARIPEMVGAYFADMLTVLRALHSSICRGGAIWMVVGDSSYAGVHIKVGEILAELAEPTWRVGKLEPCRSMRASAQQGGRAKLAETLLVLSRR